MASKAFLFMLAFVLLLTRMVSSTGDVENFETKNGHHHHHHRHANAPAHAPVYAPLHAPAMAPIHVPKKGSSHAPAKAPAHAPKSSAAHTPAKSPSPHGCVAQCESYCKPISPKRPCMKTCTACCAKCKCVPGLTKCSNCINSVEIHGKFIKCP